MNMTLVTGLLVFVIVFFLLRMPQQLLRFLGTSTIRLTIALLALLFLNVIGNQFGVNVPINLFTLAVSSILGIFGVLSLLAIQIFIF